MDTDSSPETDGPTASANPEGTDDTEAPAEADRSRRRRRLPATLFQGRRMRIIFLVAVLGVLLAAAYRLRSVLNPLLIALLVAYVTDPAVRLLEHRARMPRVAAILLFFLTCGGVLGGVGAYLYGRTTQGLNQIVTKASGGWQLVSPEEAQLPPEGAAAPENGRDEPGDDDSGLPDEPEGHAGTGEDPTPAEPRGPVYRNDLVVEMGPNVAYLDINADGMRDEQEPLFERDGVGRLVLDADARRAGWRHTPGLFDRIKEDVLSRYKQLDRAAVETVVERIKENTSALTSAAASFWGWVSEQIFGGLLTAFSYLVLVPIYAFFLLHGFPGLVSKVEELLPGRNRDRIVPIVRKIDRACAAFFRGRLLIALCKGLLTWLGLWLVGVDFALFIGFVAGALSIIPFLGPVIGFALSAFFSYSPVGWGTTIVGTLIIFCIVEVLEAIANPFVLGLEVGLHPMTIIICLFAFGELFGLFGLLLAIPMGAIAKILTQEFVLPELRTLAAEPPE
ncbi:AI-2E family transporter [Planctomycetota bacterium]